MPVLLKSQGKLPGPKNSECWLLKHRRDFGVVVNLAVVEA